MRKKEGDGCSYRLLPGCASIAVGVQLVLLEGCCGDSRFHPLLSVLLEGCCRHSRRPSAGSTTRFQYRRTACLSRVLLENILVQHFAKPKTFVLFAFVFCCVFTFSTKTHCHEILQFLLQYVYSFSILKDLLLAKFI